MGKKKGKGPKQSSRVAGSSKDQYGPDKQPDGSKENMEGGGAQCEDTSVTHPVKSDVPHTGLMSGRPPSPVPSGVSMMSDNSTGDRPNMREEPVPSGPRLMSGRPPSPVPSCVSMKSDHSTGDRPNMAGESVPSGPRLMSGRPPSPVPSGVSMKSDNSTGDRPNMREEPVPYGPRLKSGRPASPVPSCVSMMSDNSTGGRPNMTEDHVPSGPRLKSGRPPSPVPSGVSMKSDNSTGDRPNMREEPVPSGPSRENIEGEGEPCEDTSVTHPGKSDDPDIKDKLDDPHTSDRDDDADSAVCSEASMPRDNDFSNTQPHNLIHQSEVCKRCEGSCGVCLGNVHHAVKHCKTCSVSYCETHVADHYKPPAFSSHELVDYKQTSGESSAKEQSPKRTSSDPVELPEMRVMMLGKTGTGKSASGNTILGRKAFKSEASASPVTKSCDSQSGVVEGRNITVIDTPAITTRQAEWLSEKEDPGPHVFLLVIQLGKFTEEDGIEVKWIESYFGEEALKFTIVLFTGGDQLNGKPFDDFLNESSKLQTLLGHVERRYHVFNNSPLTDHDQVKGLIKKIGNVLISKLGYAYTHEERQKVKTKYEREKENAERTWNEELEKVKMVARQEYEREKAERTRNQEEKNMRDNQAHNAGDIPHPSEVRIVLLGYRTAGKSSSGNTILGREEFDPDVRTLQCVKRQGEVAGRQVTVVDTPCFWINTTVKDTPELIKQQIVHSVSLCPPGPHAVLLVIRVFDSIKELQRKNIEEHLRLAGEELWSHTMVLFTYGDWLGDTTIEQHIESEGESLHWLIEKCGHRYHVLNNKNKEDDSQVTELLEKIEGMVVRNRGLPIWNGGETQDREMDETAAGLGGLDLQRSKSWLINLSGDDRSEMFTVGSSAYGTHTSAASCEALSEWGSQESISDVSSGIGSMSSGALRSSIEARGIKAKDKTGQESDTPEHNKAGIQASKAVRREQVDS